MSKLFNKLFFFLYSILFFITPLIMFHKTSEIFEFNKILLIYLISSAVLCLWLSKMIIYKKIYFRKSILHIPLLIFLASQIASTIYSIDPQTSFFGYYGRFNGGLLSTVSYMILYFALISNVGKSEIIKLLKISIITSAIVILWGIPGKFGFDLTCLLFTGHVGNSCWTAQFRPAERMFSTLGQPNWLGAYLVIIFFIGLYFYLKETEVRRKLVILGYLLLNFTAILFTRSRSAFFSLPLSFSLVFIYILFKNRDYLKKIVVLTLSLLFLVFIFKTGIPRIDNILNLNLSKKTTKQFNNETIKQSKGVTESFDIRRIVWQGALSLGLEYPFFGTGVETFGQSYYFVRPREHNLTSEWDFIYNKAHNEYLNFLATAGFTGLITYLVFIATILLIVFDKLKVQSSKFKDDFFLTFCLLTSWLTILVTNFFGFSTTNINLFFYLIPGFILLISNNEIRENEDKLPKADSSQKILILFPLVIFIFSCYYIRYYFLADINFSYGLQYQNIGEYETSTQYFKKALQLRSEHVYQDKLSSSLASLSIISAGEKGNKKEIVKKIGNIINESDFYNLESLKSAPKQVLYWKTRAKNYYIFYQLTPDEQIFKKANEAFQIAESIAPTDPKLYWSQALLYVSKYENAKELNIKNPEKLLSGSALSRVQFAIVLKPDYRDAWFLKGQILKKLGRADEAKALFKYILDKIDPADAEVKKEMMEL